MKKIKTIIICFLPLLMLTSCAENAYTCTDLMYIMQNSLGTLPVSSIYFSESFEGENTYISSDSLTELYGSDIASFSKSYSIMLSKGTQIYEIHIFKALSNKDSNSIEALLYKRLERLQDKDVYIYDDEHFENVISRGRVCKKGLYVFLLVTQDNDALQKSIDKAL